MALLTLSAVSSGVAAGFALSLSFGGASRSLRNTPLPLRVLLAMLCLVPLAAVILLDARLQLQQTNEEIVGLRVKLAQEMRSKQELHRQAAQGQGGGHRVTRTLPSVSCNCPPSSSEEMPVELGELPQWSDSGAATTDVQETAFLPTNSCVPRLQGLAKELFKTPSRIIPWKPRPDRFLLALCYYGRTSNNIMCIQRYMAFAALLNRTLLVPTQSFNPVGRPGSIEAAFDIGHVQACLGPSRVYSVDGFLFRSKRRMLQVSAWILVKSVRVPWPAIKERMRAVKFLDPFSRKEVDVNGHERRRRRRRRLLGDPSAHNERIGEARGSLESFDHKDEDVNGWEKGEGRRRLLENRSAHNKALWASKRMSAVNFLDPFSRKELDVNGHQGRRLRRKRLQGDLSAQKGEEERGGVTRGVRALQNLPDAGGLAVSSHLRLQLRRLSQETQKSVFLSEVRRPTVLGLREFLGSFGGLPDQFITFGDIFLLEGEEGLPGLYEGPNGPLNPLPPCQLIVQPSASIVRAAHEFTRSLLGRNYVAVHLRRTDFSDHCKRPGFNCWFSIRQLAECLAARLALPELALANVSTVYLATDGRKAEVQAFQVIVGSLVSRKVAFVHMTPSFAVQLSGTPVLRDWHARMMNNPETLALFEKMVCVGARVFWGSVRSTFSKDVMRMRLGVGKDHCLDHYICQEMLPEKPDLEQAFGHQNASFVDSVPASTF